MTLSGLDHVTLRVRPEDLVEIRTFYVDVLGLEDGERPPFTFPGHWLYAGGRPVIHLAGRAGPAAGRDTGGVDHIAFSASGLTETRARLKRLGVPCREQTVPLLGLHQLFVTDPAGVTVELNFPASVAGAPGA